MPDNRLYIVDSDGQRAIWLLEAGKLYKDKYASYSVLNVLTGSYHQLSAEQINAIVASGTPLELPSKVMLLHQNRYNNTRVIYELDADIYKRIMDRVYLGAGTVEVTDILSGKTLQLPPASLIVLVLESVLLE